jgi:hypothetical protein
MMIAKCGFVSGHHTDAGTSRFASDKNKQKNPPFYYTLKKMKNSRALKIQRSDSALTSTSSDLRRPELDLLPKYYKVTEDKGTPGYQTKAST